MSTLGLDPEYFWSLTLAEFDGLVERRVAVRRREIDYPPALVCTIFANSNRNIETHPEPFEVADFMPIEGDDPDRPDTSEIDHTTMMLAKAEWMAAMFAEPEDLPRWARPPSGRQ